MAFLEAGGAGRQGASGETMVLPDFRNLAVVIRILVLSESVRLLMMVAYAPDPATVLQRVAIPLVPFEVSLLMATLSLFACGPLLRQLPPAAGMWIVIALCAGIGGGLELAAGTILGAFSWGEVMRAVVVGSVLAGTILGYFNWRQRVLSPALAEARLMALQARIRPHFLFNSLNAAVSVVRADPRLAERVLLDMCDLFRALLAEGRGLVPLTDEIRLAQAYLEIEQLRLGDRLSVEWNVMDLPGSTVVPVLLLQPLLENAVYHGIERAPNGGRVSVAIERNATKLAIIVRNPLAGSGEVAPGNRMALANIRERLALHFDAEATLRAENREGEFVVTVALPVVS